MSLLLQLLHLRGPPGDEAPADASAVLTIRPRVKGPRPGQHQQNGAAKGAAAGQLCEHPGSPFAALSSWHPFSSKRRPTEDTRDDKTRQFLDLLPGTAAGHIWEQLSPEEQRALRLVDPLVCSAFSRAVCSLQLTARDVRPGDVHALSSRFPDLSKLQLCLGPDASAPGVLELLQELKGVRLPHLHTFVCDVKLRGEALLAVARFLVRTPSLRVLRLPNQRGGGAANDQHLLCAVIEALPHLRELDLGGAGAQGSASGGNAVSPSLLRRITRLLPDLTHLALNAASIPDDQLASLGQLSQLQELSLSAACGGQQGGPARGLVAGLSRLARLSSLELQHPSLGPELVGALGGLGQLASLALGLCPAVTPDILPEVSGLQQLQKLALPFPLGPPELRLLSRLPHLAELLCWCGLELDVLGPGHDPLPSVTRLVAGSINGHGQPLGAWFPALHEVCLRSCGDMEALSLATSTSLAVLIAGGCAGLSDHGFAALRKLRALTRLSVEDAGQLSDASFAVVFSNTMPSLANVTLSGCPGITDTALQALTGSCRRLASISLSSCHGLSDKTLKRLSHCEHLASVTLRGCRALTADGVAALGAAPRMKAVSVSGCPGVRKSACTGCFRPGVRVRVDSSRRQSVA